MRCAYNEMYLDDAMRNLGEAVDFAVNTCGLEPDRFMGMFIASGLADQFGRGVPRYVCGLSGIELACEIFDRAGLSVAIPEEEIIYDLSAAYWSGWILAYYQWQRNLRFKQIMQYLPMTEILKLYPVLHEAPEKKFIDTADAIAQRKLMNAKLQTLRRAAGYSQRLLAARSGVSLRMIQQYEQGVKDISKASASSLKALSESLGCRIEEFIE